MTVTYAAFDASTYLDNNATIAEYISATLEDLNPVVFLGEKIAIVADQP